MFSIKQPNQIVIGNGSAHDFQYPNNSLLITSKGAKSRGWIKYLDVDESVTIYDQVENNLLGVLLFSFFNNFII